MPVCFGCTLIRCCVPSIFIAALRVLSTWAAFPVATTRTVVRYKKFLKSIWKIDERQLRLTTDTSITSRLLYYECFYPTSNLRETDETFLQQKILWSDIGQWPCYYHHHSSMMSIRWSSVLTFRKTQAVRESISTVPLQMRYLNHYADWKVPQGVKYFTLFW